MGRRKKVKFPFDNGESRTSAMSQSYSPRQHYSLDEKLDLSESRSIEFKAGPGFINNGFRDNVGKYVCGFVNSNENGTLLLGVENSGLVRGYRCNRGEEDFIRRQVDEAVKDISPDVFPRDYSLRFVPVLDHHGNHSDENYVIEISVLGSNIVLKDRLYECKQGVFLRRDGSLEGPLKAKKIQEWTRRIFESEMEKMRRNERNYQKELENKTSQLESEKKKFQKHQMDSERTKELEVQTKDLERENKSMKTELQSRDVEQEQLKERIRQLEAKLEQGHQHSEETLKELGEIKQLLSKKTKSTACTIM